MFLFFSDGPTPRCGNLTTHMFSSNHGPKSRPTMIWKRDLEPLEKTITNKSKNLQDIKSLLEDRGGDDANRDVKFKRKVYSNNSRSGLDSYISDAVSSCGNNVCERYRRSWCFRFKTIVFVVFVMLSVKVPAEARSSGE